MKTPSRTLAILLGSIASLVPARAVDIQKLNNATALNLGGSWVGGVAPGINDVAVWDNLVTGPNSSALGADTSWLGIRVANVGGTRNGSNTQNVTIANASSANTLTLGAAGIDMSAAFQTLVIQSRIALNANQTWNIADANTNANPATLSQNEDLTFLSQAANTAFNLGGFTVNKTGAGTVALSSGFSVANGTFNVNAGVLHIQGGTSRLTTVNSTVNFNVASGATLRFAAQSAPAAGGISLQSNAPITLNTGSTFAILINQTQQAILTGNMTIAGNTTFSIFGGSTGINLLSGNLLGSDNIAYNNTATNAAGLLRLSGDNSGYSGALTLGGASGTRALRLNTATSGSAAATWNVNAANTLQVDGVSVQLGTLNGAGTVTNSSAANPATLNVGAGTFSGSITNGTPLTALNKITGGTLVLSGFNSYTGDTTVSAGTLIATPSALNGSNVTVADAATFGVRVDSPGSTLSVPVLTTGTSAASTLLIEAGSAGNLLGPAFTTTTFTPLAPTAFKITGSGFMAGTFPLLSYTGAIGGLGFNGLSLVLPPRIIGALANNGLNSTVDVNITGLDLPKWTGAVNGDWDIDNGTGTGTLNWREVTNGGVTRYIQTVSGSDSVRFDDSATGTTTVNLTTVLTPNAVTVDNSALTYTFTGSGRLTGGGSLTKAGSGALIIANGGVNDYTGGTTITAGSVQLGDGVTAGVGNVFGAVTNDASLVLHRPDDFTVPAIISGSGGLTKNAANVATLSGATNLSGDVAINAGTLRFTGGGSLSGAIGGAGGLAVAGGTLQLSGPDANSYAGATTISNGVLQLNKDPNVNAVPGDVLITGGGVLTLQGTEQIPDTATITFTGTSADSTGGSFGTETVANVVVNPSVATGQFIMRNGFTVTGTATVQNGILGVGSSNTATVNSIILSPAGIVRIAGSGGPSTLNVGAGGITASGGEIQVKFNTNAQDAVLNLGGDFTATGNVAITNANFVGGNLNQINLLDARTFTIADGTTTTVRPTVDGLGSLTKNGGGTIDLIGTAGYAGDTVVNAGTLRTSTLQANTASVTVSDGATLSVRVAQPGTSLFTPAFTLGSAAAGGKLIIDLNGLGNPTGAPFSVTAFTANGASEVTILGPVTSGIFPLVDYDGTIGGSGIGGFTLTLPLRVAGVLQNDTANTVVNVNILGVDTPKWIGNLSSAWDIDDGTGTGTANWRTSVSNVATRYLQGAGGTDQVIFDDSAVNPNVQLTTTLTPVSITVDAATTNYTFGGSGKLSGATGLLKRGAATLTIANTTANDYTGATVIEAGALQIGDGVTAGAGTLGTAAVVNDSTLILNRPDDFTFANVISGSGSLVKNGAGVATLSTIPTYFGTTTINTGTLALNFTGVFNSVITNNAVLQLDNAVTLASAISGSGALVAQGAGTKVITGGDANTYTGLTTVSSGTLSLNKAQGVNAVGGNVAITGTGVLAITTPDQIPDTATITHTGSVNTTLTNETVGTIVVNTTAGAQIIANPGLVVSDAVQLQAGVFSVASGSSSTVNQVIMSGGILRAAANSLPSTLTIGSGGIVASGGVIEVGNGVGAFDAVLVLGGDLSASATLDLNRGGFFGLEKREIDLGAALRNFNITAGTTTVRPNLVGAAGGGLTKTGAGTLTLLGNQNYPILTTNGGVTNLNSPLPDATITNTSGTLNVNASATNSAVIADAATNFSASQTLASLTIGAGGVVTLTVSAGPEPGAAFEPMESGGAPLQAVPEPGAVSLLATGLLGLVARRWRTATRANSRRF